ncbi:MAG: uracil-DNA glycosylase [Gammaproteobacteria bacterium]|nr:uracil-DNA glycosylase [Gammaproteobacteria bacterium]
MGIQTWVERTQMPGQVVEPQVAKAEAVEPLPEAIPEPRADDIPPWLDDVPPPTQEWEPAVDLYEPENDHRDDVARLDWAGLRDRVKHCEGCDLCKSRKQTVFGVGNQSADIMIIGEAPGVEEDRQGEPFVGRAGQLLTAMLLAMGLQREEVFIANILKCRPPGNRDPRPEEALRCEPFLRRQVKLVKPKVILAVGRVAAQNLLKSQEAVGRMRGKAFRFDDIPTVVTYHPAYLLRSPQHKSRAWKDLQRTLGVLRK